MSTHNLRTTHCVLCTRVYDTICDIYALWHVRLRRATAASEDQNETWYRFLLTGIPRNKDFAITYLVYRCKKCGC